MQNTLKHIKKITMVLLTAMVIIATGCTKPDDPNSGNGGNNCGNDNEGGNNGGGHYNGNYEYVDFGLPSGTLWATFNVGADRPESYGDFFAWAETSPKTTYDWNSYKYTYGGDQHSLTKYCYKFSYGYNQYFDTLYILEPCDDAATVNWGNGWCTPTLDQWLELYSNTIVSVDTLNGVEGRRFSGNNGKSLFLPRAGYCKGEALRDVLSKFQYWTCKLYHDYSFGGDPRDAYVFALYGNEWSPLKDVQSRYWGLPVRPVRYTNNNGGGNNGGGNEGEELLTITDFEWYREGSSQGVGLDDYGLYWVNNAKPVCAQIKPLDGVTLYNFDSSVWNATETEDDKAALFSNSTNTIEVYNNVSVWASATYDDVIGTRKADGSMHLIHVTNCVIGDYQSGVGYSYHIYGQSK